MRPPTAIIAILAIITAGCASQPQAGSSINGLPALGQSRNKIHSLEEGLPPAQAASALPIMAVAEQDGWFLYATATFTDATTHQPVGFISGLAIRHGTREIVSWSIW